MGSRWGPSEPLVRAPAPPSFFPVPDQQPFTLARTLLFADVEGLDRASLKVAVWSGDVTLTDVRLRREACYAIGLPVNVKLAVLDLSWNHLQKDSAIAFSRGPAVAAARTVAIARRA